MRFRGLLSIVIICKYGESSMGVGTLIMLLEKTIDLCIMVSNLPHDGRLRLVRPSIALFFINLYFGIFVSWMNRRSEGVSFMVVNWWRFVCMC